MTTAQKRHKAIVSLTIAILSALCVVLVFWVYMEDDPRRGIFLALNHLVCTAIWSINAGMDIARWKAG